MHRFGLPALIISLALPVVAQQAHYPLGVGDRWQLRQITSTNPPLYSFLDFTITSDTVMPNGQTYYGCYDGWRTLYQRQQGSQVLRYSPLEGSEYVWFDFSRSIGDTVGFYASPDTFDVVLSDTGVWSHFGRSGRSWSFTHFARWLTDANSTWTIADSFGVIRIEGALGPYSILGAVIAGRAYGTIVSVESESRPAPLIVTLHQNYPNPFNPTTRIGYTLPRRTVVEITILDLLGRSVARLKEGEEAAGYHDLTFDGSRLGSGTYFCRLRAGEAVRVRAMVLLR